MTRGSCLIEFSLAAGALLDRGVLVSLCGSWVNCWWIFITWVRWSNGLSELERHHFPFWQFTSSTWYRLILSFSLGVLFLLILQFFLFFWFFNEFYLFITNYSFFLHIESFSLFDENILADFHMLLIGFLVKLSVASRTLLESRCILSHIGGWGFRFFFLNLTSSRTVCLIFEMLTRCLWLSSRWPVIFLIVILLLVLVVVVIWVKCFTIIIISFISNISVLVHLSLIRVFLVLSRLISAIIWTLPAILWMSVSWHCLLANHTILASRSFGTFESLLF